MKLLLTSGGVSNLSIEKALVNLLGKPIAESHALFVPTAVYAIPGGGEKAGGVARGTLGSPFCGLGWKSLGLLELTALSSLKRKVWMDELHRTDALLVGGGDCQYLCYWMQHSGLAAELPGLLNKMVYVGLSAGSMIMTRYGTTYNHHSLPKESDKCLGLLDFAIHPHMDHASFPSNSMANMEKLAATLPMSSYLIDDETAIQVVDGKIDVVSEGKWKLVTP